MAGPTVVVSVLADTKKLKSGMDDAGKGLGGLKNVAAGIAAGVAVAVGAVAAGVAKCIGAAQEAQVVAAQTEAVINSTGGAAGKSVADIDKLAGSLSKLSGIDDEVVKSGANVLLTFTNIKGANFDAATLSALNMSQALKTDLQSSSILVGKALNDPLKGITALTRAGVQFTQQQKDQIEAMVAAGDVAGAQGIILAELNTQFAGSAEAYGNTFEGMKGKAKTALGNVMETIGGAFLPALTALFGRIAGVLDAVGSSPAFNAIIQNVSAFVTQLLSGEGAVGQFGAAFAQILPYLSPFGLILQALMPVLPQVAESFKGLAVTLAAALMPVLPVLGQLLATLVQVLSGVLVAVLPIVAGLVAKLAQVFASILPVLLPVVTLLATILADALVRLMPVIVMLADVLGQVLMSALTAVQPLLGLLAQVILQVLTALAPIIPVVFSLIEAFMPLIGVLGQLIAAILPPVVQLLVALLKPILALISPLLNLLIPVLQFLVNVLAGIIGIVAAVIGAFVGLITGSKDTQRQVRQVWQGVLDFFGSIPQKIGAFFSGAVNWLRDAGVNIVRGLMNGLSSMAGTVGKFFLNLLPGWIVGPFKAALGIRSPSRLFRQFGTYTIQGLVQGIDAGRSSVTGAMGRLSGVMSDGFTPGALAGSYAGNAGPRPLQVNVTGGLATSADIGRAVVDAVEEYERLNGKRA